MKKKKRPITYLLSVIIAIIIALLTVYFEMSTYGKETVMLMRFFSDGFFLSAVLYLGFGLLNFISDAGNFFGMQYLGYTVLYLFSFKKSHEDKKDYFSYCMEKKAAKKEKGNSYFKWMLLLIGLGCLILSVLFAAIYYQLLDLNWKML